MRPALVAGQKLLPAVLINPATDHLSSKFSPSTTFTNYHLRHGVLQSLQRGHNSHLFTERTQDDDAMSSISDATTLVEVESTPAPPERPVSPPVPCNEGRQPYRRTPNWDFENDAIFGDFEVRLVPTFGRIVDLIRIHPVATTRPTPRLSIMTPLYTRGATQPSEMRLGQETPPCDRTLRTW